MCPYYLFLLTIVERTTSSLPSHISRWYLPFKSHSLHRSVGTVSFRAATATTTVKIDDCTTVDRFLRLRGWLFCSLKLCRNRFSRASLEKLISPVRCSTRANKWINRHRHSFSFNRLTSQLVWIESKVSWRQPPVHQWVIQTNKVVLNNFIERRKKSINLQFLVFRNSSGVWCRALRVWSFIRSPAFQ